MSNVRHSRIYASLPHELSKAIKMKAILDECTVSEVLINALSLAYPDDQMISKAIEDYVKEMESDGEESESHNNPDASDETNYSNDY